MGRDARNNGDGYTIKLLLTVRGYEFEYDHTSTGILYRI